LGALPFVWSPPRPAPGRDEYAFAILLLILLSLESGLFFWHREHRSCPVGARRAGGIAGIIGAATLLCPACTVLPLTLLGASVSLGVLGPFLPLLRIISLLIAVAALIMLWPRKHV
jgi:hypothetical protein